MENCSGEQHCLLSRQHCSPTTVYYLQPRCVLCYTGSARWCPSRKEREKIERTHSLAKFSLQLPWDQDRECRCDWCPSSMWWSSWCQLTDISVSSSSDTPDAVHYSSRPHTHTHTHTDTDKTQVHMGGLWSPLQGCKTVWIQPLVSHHLVISR